MPIPTKIPDCDLPGSAAPAEAPQDRAGDPWDAAGEDALLILPDDDAPAACLDRRARWRPARTQGARGPRR